jgi:hypothetical protein
LTQTERGKAISFFNELDTVTRTMLVTSVSFFNKVAIETKNYPRMVSFFNELESRKLCSSLVSFFNELEIRKSCSSLVSFLNELEMRKSCSKTSVSFFNEVASEMQKLSSSGFIF